MIWFALIAGFLAPVGLLIFLFVPDEETRTGSGLFALVTGVLFLVLGAISSITVVPAGNVGVVVLFGSVGQGPPLSSGMHMANPFSSVEKMSVRTENYWMSHQQQEGNTKGDDSVTVRSSNGLQMPVDLSVPYRLVPDSAPWVYQNLGTDYITKLLRPSLSTAARRAASAYTSEELYSTKRDEFAGKILTLMEEELSKVMRDGYKGASPPEQILIVSQVLVGHVGIPDKVRESIESKLKADQEQQAMDFTILKEKKEAERKQVEAEGIQKFQEIVARGIDERLLRWKAIDATLHLAQSQNTKVIVIGGGKDALPIILGNAVEEARGKQ